MTRHPAFNSRPTFDALTGSLFAAIPDGVLITDCAGRVSFANPAMRALLRCDDSAVGRPLDSVLKLLDDDHGQRWEPLSALHPEAGQVDRQDLLLCRPTGATRHGDGDPVPVSVSAVPIDLACGQGALLVVRDATVVKAHVAALATAAQQDPLTGLPNRNLFVDRLGQAIRQAARDRQQSALLFIDLDNFKGINDTHGHAAGDTVLKTVAERLRASVRGNDSVSRYAGDEFTVLLGRLQRIGDAVHIVNKIRRSLSQPVRYQGINILCSASIGVAVYPDDGHFEKALLRSADSAMYHAKQLGKNRAWFNTTAYNKLLDADRGRETELAAALDGGQFRLHFQPRWDLPSEQLVAFEALLRWQHPTRGLLAAADFIDLSERNGFIRMLGRWTLVEAAGQLRRWQRLGLPAIPVNVNLSVQQFRHQDLPAQVARTLEAFDLPADSLELDVSAIDLHQQAEVLLPELRQLAELGTGLNLSGFGSSSLSWRALEKVPAHSLQLDRELIRRSQTSAADAATVAAAVKYAAHLGRPISASGVETTDQREFLLQQGCRQMQGHLIHPPMAAETVPEYLGYCRRYAAGY